MIETEAGPEPAVGDGVDVWDDETGGVMPGVITSVSMAHGRMTIRHDDGRLITWEPREFSWYSDRQAWVEYRLSEVWDGHGSYSIDEWKAGRV